MNWMLAPAKPTPARRNDMIAVVQSEDSKRTYTGEIKVLKRSDRNRILHFEFENQALFVATSTKYIYERALTREKFRLLMTFQKVA